MGQSSNYVPTRPVLGRGLCGKLRVLPVASRLRPGKSVQKLQGSNNELAGGVFAALSTNTRGRRREAFYYWSAGGRSGAGCSWLRGIVERCLSVCLFSTYVWTMDVLHCCDAGAGRAAHGRASTVHCVTVYPQPAYLPTYLIWSSR